MAKVVLGDELGHTQMTEPFQDLPDFFAAADSVAAFGIANIADAYFFVLGKGFQFDGEFMEAGTVTGASFVLDGKVAFSIRGLKLDADDINDVLLNAPPAELVSIMLSGNDTVLGTNGDNNLQGFGGKDTLQGRAGFDILIGNAGKDRLTGGKDHDVFVISDGDGRDVVTDYNFTGEDHDTVTIFGREFFFERQGKNTLMDFGDGDAVLFLNVKPNQIELEP